MHGKAYEASESSGVLKIPNFRYSSLLIVPTNAEMARLHGLTWWVADYIHRYLFI